MNEWIDFVREVGSLGLLAIVLWRNNDTQKTMLVQMANLTAEIKELKQIVCKS